MGRIAQETGRGLKWGMIQKFTMQPVQLLYGMLLAHLITPDEMGILGLTSAFFVFAGQLQNCGFGSALIRKQDRTDEDICTVFWFNVTLSLALAACLFLSAPWFASFFNQPPLLNLTRVSAILMFLNSTSSVHYTLYNAKRDFKTPALIGMFSTFVPMPFTIWAAYAGWSYWSLMVQSVLSSAISLLAIWTLSPWKPSMKWSAQSFREFFSFGSKLMLSGMVWTFYDESRKFVIGKFYSPAQLAYYTRGDHLCSAPMSLVQGLMNGVTFPIFATIQHDRARLFSVYHQYISLMSLIIEWGMITLAVNSTFIVMVCYGHAWVPAAEYCRLLCLGTMFTPLSNTNSNLYNVLGRSDLSLKKEIILRSYGLPAIFVGAYFGVFYICLASVSVTLLALVVSLVMSTRCCNLSIKSQLGDFMPYLLCAFVSNIPALFFHRMEWHPAIILICSLATSLGLYMLMLYVRRDAAACYLMHHLRQNTVLGKLFPLAK